VVTEIQLISLPSSPPLYFFSQSFHFFCLHSFIIIIIIIIIIVGDSNRRGVIKVDLLDDLLRSGVLGWRSWLPPLFIKSDPAAMACEAQANK
jgi:hypothetical protein